MGDLWRVYNSIDSAEKEKGHTYVVVSGWYSKSDPKDDHSWCIGIYDNLTEAIGRAYRSIGFTVSDCGEETEEDPDKALPLIQCMDDDAGWVISRYVGNTYEYYLIYDYYKEESSDKLSSSISVCG